MSPDTLKGTWTLVSWTRQAVEDMSISYPFGLSPQGHVGFDGTQIMGVAHKDVASIQQVCTINDGLSKDDVTEFSYMGSYQLENDMLSITYQECSDPSKVGQHKQAKVWFDGHVTLTITAAAPIEVDGKQYLPSATFVRKP